MTNIPFPNPHDSDALNDYLDELAAGKQAIPESDVEMAAMEFHQLASRAEVNATQQPIEQPRGEQTMHTATLTAPVSNRTRRQMAKEKRPSKSYGWLSAVIVAGLMISMIGMAWLNREPGNPNDNLAFAPGTAEALTSFECPVTLPNNVDAEGGLDHYAADGHTWYENGIWITIPTDGTLNVGSVQQDTDPESEFFGWGFEKLMVLRSEEVSGMVEITGERLDQDSELTPTNDTTVDHYYGTTGFVPVALMIPGEGCWQFTATAGDASATWITKVEFVDPPIWTQPITSEDCPIEEIEESVLNNAPSGLLYSQEDYDGISTDRSYDVESPANNDDSRTIVSRARDAYACGMQSETLPFWTVRFEYENRTDEGQRSLDTVVDQRIDDASEIMRWYETELGLTESDLIVRVNPSLFGINDTERSVHIGPFNPEFAVQLVDGRIAIIHTVILYGDAEYEPSIHQGLNVTIFAPEDGKWMVDEIVPVRFSDKSDKPWTQPISASECPDDAKPNAHEINNPSSTMYTEEDYDQVSSERSYDIIGPPSPEDANAIVLRMRETQACIWEGKSTLKWTARFEYETRTTDGRASVEASADERSEGADSVSTWLEDEYGYTIHDLMVYQNPDDLSLDGTESVIDTGLGNPALAVEFSDGRVGIIMSLVSYEPFPDEWDFESLPGFEAYMIIFTYQDGEWMLDENLPMCIGDCSELPVGTPMPGLDPMATPVETPSPVQPTPTHVPRGGDNRG